MSILNEYNVNENNNSSIKYCKNCEKETNHKYDYGGLYSKYVCCNCKEIDKNNKFESGLQLINN